MKRQSREMSPEKRRQHDHKRSSRNLSNSPENKKPSLRELKEHARREVEHRDRQDDRRHRHEDRSDRYRNDDRRDRPQQQRDNRQQLHWNDNRNERIERSRPDEPRQDRNRQLPRLEEGNRKDGKNNEEEPLPEIRPNFGLTGALARDTNTVNGVVVKYNEPAEAKKSLKKWRLYPFKNDKPLDYIEVYRQSAYLFGRDRKVADIPIDHLSCSKQHAVLQYRSIEFERSDGTKGKRTRPYIIDLESANKTYINKKPIDPRRYVELFEKDVIQFGFSSREYVLLHESSIEDDIAEEAEEEKLF